VEADALLLQRQPVVEVEEVYPRWER
jgi:hypothetical protein